MYPGSSVTRFLRDTYPGMHMAIYDGVCNDKRLRSAIPEAINSLLDGGSGKFESGLDLGFDGPMARRVSRILSSLARRGLESILIQIRDGVSQGHLDTPVRGVLLQRIESNRWEERFAAEKVNDLVLVVPEWSKVIALSSTEIDETKGADLPVFGDARLANFHIYTFFNRAHGVRGRVVRLRDDVNEELAPALRPLWRSCEDISKIVLGHNLPYFAPIDTLEGLRLAFYFTVACRIASVQSVASPAGAGYDLSQVKLNLVDSTGAIPVMISQDAFSRSLDFARNNNTMVPVSDMGQLDKLGEAVVLGAWFLGGEHGYVAHLFLEGSIEFANPSALAHLNSVRKVLSNSSYGMQLAARLKTRTSPNLARVNPWFYYKEDSWPLGLFAAMARKGFSPLTFSEAVNAGLDLGRYKERMTEIISFFSNNPHLLRLYLSEDPASTFKEMHAAIREAVVRNEEAPAIEAIEFDIITERNQIPELCRLLRAGDFEPSDVFDWSNGGYQLERLWMRVRERFGKRSVRELESSLLFILSTAGNIHIPQSIVRGTLHDSRMN